MLIRQLALPACLGALFLVAACTVRFHEGRDPSGECGNGLVEDTEECDDGTANSDTLPNACRTECLLAFCGDEVRDASEECDNGTENDDTYPNACRTDCRRAWCGDGILDNAEECDLGSGNNDLVPDTCRTICRMAFCGDGVLDTGEGCDDGNNVGGDGCGPSCQTVPCDIDGDGYERYDPGNNCPNEDYPTGKATDCDDTDGAVFPGITDECGGDEGGTLACAAYGLCDGKDNDCDGDVDEGCPLPACDFDQDGFQTDAPGCSPPPGLQDCDDSNPLIYPGAPDICGDGILQNCNTDTPCSSDGDGDGYNASEDCNDQNALVFPGAVETCNATDDDCDGLVDEGNPDANGNPMVSVYCNDDNDGICGNPEASGRCVCSAVIPGTAPDGDNRVACAGEDLQAPASPRCYFAPQPGLEECDAFDHDCNGVADDPEGLNLLERGQPCGPDTGACVPGVVIGCDLNQTTTGAHDPNFICSEEFVGPEPETCNGLDDDCDGAIPQAEQDIDGDGYIQCTDCEAAVLAPDVLGCNDCVPSDPSFHPGAPELCNGRDENCVNGVTDDGVDECAGVTPDCCSTLQRCVDLSSDFSACGNCLTACDSLRANRCEASQCRCGSGPPCDSGQQCVGSGANATCQCTSTSCPTGCCDEGICRAGTSDYDCGDNGNPCVNCAASGRDCTNQSCSCIQNGQCDGCCDGNTCLSGTSSTACGQNGQPCSNCSASGTTCVNQSCSCGAGTCSGCCDGNICRSGTTDGLCGSGGQNCVSCTGSNLDCVSQQCQCIQGGNCPGCCDGNICRGGTTDTQCGQNGEDCASCSASDQNCVGQSCTCIQGGNCSGCCSGNTCISGTSDSSCGQNGASCVNCTTSGRDCVSGSCVCIENGNCAGCCSSGICRAGTTDANCGQNGETCFTCGAGLDCVSHTCQCIQGGDCSGCCDGNICRGGGGDALCGSGGQTCQDCTASNLDCVSNQCQCTSGGNCSGCCENNNCYAGNQDTRCGVNGNPCEDCTSSGGYCNIFWCEWF